MTKRRNATDVSKPPSKPKLSTEVTKIANAITGVAKNPLVEKRKPTTKPKPAKTQNNNNTTTADDVNAASTAVPTAPDVLAIEPPPPVKRTPRPATMKPAAATGAPSGGATGVAKGKKPILARTPPEQQHGGRAKIGRPEFRYGGGDRGAGR
ncbi:hypothetical protein HO133_010337 [Letharia lupina]|uniref:Uncharacterized protein n=1 Tax=Letharia lupina TaxID=560253 RepID=A0A8H6FE86_9LECA|nr:uncharacterized protein HO133_010337 [Letharia lupina]KAF6225140.1 hypothetical protein HO133_010337 [Letharia lupina]